MTSIELLPDELWLQIFEYVSLWTLYEAFAPLNRRIWNLVTSKGIGLRLRYPESIAINQVLLQNLSEQIECLSIDFDQQNLDLSRFPNLKFLRIAHATDKQIEYLKRYPYPHLNTLVIVVSSSNHQYEEFLFNSKSCSTWRKCWFPNIQLESADYFPSMTVRSLRLNFCDIATCLQLISLLPNLVHFHTSVIPMPSSSSYSCVWTEKHFNLVTLTLIARCGITLTDLEPLLNRLSCLRHLQLKVYQQNTIREKFKLSKLAQMLENHLMTLRKCDVSVHLPNQVLKMNLQDIKDFFGNV